MLMLVACYLLIFSLIAHKEPRFLLPILPLCFLMMGQFLHTLFKESPAGWRKVFRFYLYVTLLLEAVLAVIYLRFVFRTWEPLAYLQTKEAAPHSFYPLGSLDMPHYTWTHRHSYLDAEGQPANRTIVYRPDKNPTYSRAKRQISYALLRDLDFNLCFDLIDKLQKEEMRPEYVLLHEFKCGENFYCTDACFSKFESLGLYELEQTFRTDVEKRHGEPTILYWRQRFLYKLKQGFKPF